MTVFINGVPPSFWWVPCSSQQRHWLPSRNRVYSDILFNTIGGKYSTNSNATERNNRPRNNHQWSPRIAYRMEMVDSGIIIMVPYGSHWFPMVPYVSLWFPMVPDGSHWCPVESCYTNGLCATAQASNLSKNDETKDLSWLGEVMRSRTSPWWCGGTPWSSWSQPQWCTSIITILSTTMVEAVNEPSACGGVWCNNDQHYIIQHG